MARAFDAVSLDVGGVLVVPDHGVLGGALDRRRHRARPRSLRRRPLPGHGRGGPGRVRCRRTSPTTCRASWPRWACRRSTESRAHDAPGRRAADARVVPAGAGFARRAARARRRGRAPGRDVEQRRHGCGSPRPPRVGAGGRRPGRAGGGGHRLGARRGRQARPARVPGDDRRARTSRPERILHVGDSVHYDVDGGAAVGMQAVHMDPFELCASTDHPHVRTLDALLALP